MAGERATTTSHPRAADNQSDRVPGWRTDDGVTALGRVETEVPALACVLSMIAALNAGDIDATVAHFDADIRNHGRRVGLDGMRAIFDAQRRVLPDWHHELAQTIVEGSTVVTRSFLSGTHSGILAEPVNSFMLNGAPKGIEPQGRSVRIQATHIWEVSEDDLIVVHWANRDDLGMRTQLTENR